MMEMFWGDDPVLSDNGRDQRIADGLEVAALSDGDDDYQSDASDPEPDYYNPQTKEFAAGKKKRRKLRVAGGVAPTAKPVTADYDSDDGRIIELKQLGYSDEFVAAKLVEEGRIRYVGKTIGSRYLRLRKVLDDKEDEKLDDELTDWHAGEDDKLCPIVQAMEKKLNRQIEALKVRMWKDVSAYFAGQIGGKKKYTHKACRERYEAILGGNELPPIELDEDPEGRRKMREERIKAAKAARAAEANEAIEIEARRKAKTAERKRAIAEANQKKVSFQLKRIAEKKERLRIREERIANRQLAKNTRLRILHRMRIERDWEMEKNRREKMIYKKIMGVDLNGKPASRSGRHRNAYDSDEESEAIDDLESDEEEANFTDAEEADDADDESENENVDPGLEGPTINEEDSAKDSTVGSRAVKLPPADRSRRKRKTVQFDLLADGAEPPSSPVNKKRSRRAEASTPRKRSSRKSLMNGTDHSSTPASKKKTPTKKKSAAKKKTPAPSAPDGSDAVVTEDTLYNPRSVMTRSELDTLCFTRGIPRRSADEESHPELIARMNAIDEHLTRQELDDLLRQATELTTGARMAKIERLQKSEASKSIAGGMGLDSHDLDHMRRYEGFTGAFKRLLDDAEHTAARDRSGPADKSMMDAPAFADW